MTAANFKYSACISKFYSVKQFVYSSLHGRLHVVHLYHSSIFDSNVTHILFDG